MTQTKDAVRGVTNPTTKQIFAGEYYLYDGTIEKQKAIQAARRGENNGVKKEKVNLTKDSLQSIYNIRRKQYIRRSIHIQRPKKN